MLIKRLCNTKIIIKHLCACAIQHKYLLINAIIIANSYIKGKVSIFCN